MLVVEGEVVEVVDVVEVLMEEVVEGGGDDGGGPNDHTERRLPAPQYWVVFPGQGVEQVEEEERLEPGVKVSAQ